VLLVPAEEALQALKKRVWMVEEEERKERRTGAARGARGMVVVITSDGNLRFAVERAQKVFHYVLQCDENEDELCN